MGLFLGAIAATGCAEGGVLPFSARLAPGEVQYFGERLAENAVKTIG
jgi:hypothetical protein